MSYFITGGTGSLGKALIQRLTARGDVTVYSRDEVKQAELKRAWPDVRFMLGDVRDYDRLILAMRGHTTVIHAAAYKQVPAAEANVEEAVATNVTGSLNVARAAVHNNVKYVVGVSTDKACAPVNAYGQTKALMERIFQQFDGVSDTAFNCVRYGNVLGSRGSVVPLFRRQLQSRHFTLTDPAMTRFWMTLNMAVDLVLAAVDPDAAVEDGAVLVPACQASDMFTLLRAVVQVWGDGYELPLPDVNTIGIRLPDVDIIGTRPGEKQHEQLIHINESLHTYDPTEEVPYYQILPATADYRRTPFEYTSKHARQLDVLELAAMLKESVDE